MTACGSKPKQVGEYPSENGGEGAPKSNDETPKWEGAAPPAPPLENKPSTGTGTGARGVNEAPRQRSDQYDKEATEVVIKRAARQVKENCGAAKGDDGKATGPWGKATITLQLGANGRSKGVTVPAPYQGKPVGNCVEKAFTNLTFPPWGGSDAEVSWEVELVNPAEAAKK
ncbi:MAG: hypothetical protein NVS3B10_17930 [Polyangiales bacterium]